MKVKTKKVSAMEPIRKRARAEPPPADAEPPQRQRSLNRRVLKASEQLVHTLLMDIVSDRLKPGDRLPQEPEMVEKYGVARATVREALRILEVNGLIAVRVGPGGGPTVRSATPADFGRAMSMFMQADGITMEELFLARRMLEPFMVREATLRQDPKYIAQAQDLLERCRTVDLKDDTAYMEVAREFHELTVAGSPNRVFRMFALGMMSMFAGNLGKAIYTVEKRRQVMKEHEDVLKAIIAKNAAKAEKLMMNHMEEVQESLANRFANSYQDVVGWL
jgi:GntR family transcriptional regulator, transcriptional repressor for pyruvate dehydrogenase complex